MASFYNEIEPYAAQWLRNLIKAGHIADGEVDTRSIVDVSPDDLRGFTQCHFFAGIGGWGHALRLAGWPDDRPIWTGSCPCQPFSVAGKGTGTDDPRHLWPHFHRLITAVRPPIVMGEQVAGKAGYGWLDGVRADLEREGYASRGADLPALAVNAPHIRQRLYWVALNVADAQQHGHGRETSPAHHDRQEGDGPADQHGGRGGSSVCSHMADAPLIKRNGRGCGDDLGERRGVQEQTRASDSHMADTDQGGRGRRPHDGDGERDGQAGERHKDHGVAAGGGEDRLDLADANVGQSSEGRGDACEVCGVQIAECGTKDCTALLGRGGGEHGSFWSDHIWLTGADGKSRRSKPGLPLLAHGVSGGLALVRTRKDGAEETHTYNRVGALRAFGNAIVPSLAAEVVRAFMETENATNN